MSKVIEDEKFLNTQYTLISLLSNIHGDLTSIERLRLQIALHNLHEGIAFSDDQNDMLYGDYEYKLFVPAPASPEIVEFSDKDFM